MRTYTLVFSADENVLKRRLEKAKLSNSQRILAKGFSGPPPTNISAVSFVWAWEGAPHESRPKGWDEYHLVATDPGELSSLSIDSTNVAVVIHPQKASGAKHWIEKIKELRSRLDFERIFFEFDPWTKQYSHHFTVSEVAQFLYSLRHHFPDLVVNPRPGVTRFDPRIESYFELEALEVNTREYQIQNETPEISVIIPSFNSKYFLHPVLKHLGEQSLPSAVYEVIVVDDGGTDNSWDYLKTFGISDRIQLSYLYWPRQGARTRGDSFFRAGLCRNLGVRRARGKTLVFLDSDIVVPRNFLETVQNEIKHSDVLQFPRIHVSQNDSTAQFEISDTKKAHLYIEEERYWKPFFETTSWMELESFWKYTCTYGLALKKEDFFQAGCFSRTYVSYGFEDTELGYRLSKKGKSFKLVPLNLFHLTSYTSSEYQSSKFKRRKLLQRTAKQFFLNTLDINVYHLLRGMMGFESAGYHRLKRVLGFQDRGKVAGENQSTPAGQG